MWEFSHCFITQNLFPRIVDVSSRGQTDLWKYPTVGACYGRRRQGQLFFFYFLLLSDIVGVIFIVLSALKKAEKMASFSSGSVVDIRGSRYTYSSLTVAGHS